MTERTSLRWRAKMAKRLVNRTYDTIDDDDDKTKDNRQRGICCGARFMDGVAAAAVGTSILSLQLLDGPLVQTAALCTCFFGPYVAYQRRRFQRLGGSVRKVHNELRQEHNELKRENTRLHEHAGRLQTLAQRARNAEYELMRIGNHSKQQIRRLCHIVEEQRRIQAQIKQKLRAATIQNLMSVVVKSDRNKDFSLSPTEVEIVIVRIGMMEGVHINEKEFRQRMEQDPDRSLQTIMQMIRALMQDDDDVSDEDEAVIKLCPEELMTTTTPSSGGRTEDAGEDTTVVS